MEILKKVGLALTLALALVIGACSEGGVESQDAGEQIEEGLEGVGEGMEEEVEQVEEDLENNN